jgi:hypothetical protein
MLAAFTFGSGQPDRPVGKELKASDLFRFLGNYRRQVLPRNKRIAN